MIVHAPPDVAANHIGPTVGVIEPDPDDPDRSIVTIGGDPDWIASYLVSLEVRFEVLDPPEVRDEICALAYRMLEQHGAAAGAAST